MDGGWSKRHNKRLKLSSGSVDSKSNIDRISQLPDSVAQHIFSFLPSEYLVRCSVLSKRWKDVWLSVNSLNFYLRNFRSSRVTVDVEDVIHRFCDLVNNVLHCRDRFSDITKFRMSWLSPDEPRDSNCFSSWIRSVVGYNVKVLHLKIGFPPMLPSSLFMCPSLEHFSLKLVHKEEVRLPHTPIYLPNLKYLSFHNVMFSPKDEISVQALFSASPVLETLVLEQCWVEDFTNVSITASHLKNLIINQGFCCVSGMIPNDKGINLEVSAPSLVQLKLMHGFSSNDFYVFNIPAVVDAFIQVEFDSVTLGLVEILKALGNAQTVHIHLRGDELEDFSQEEILLLENSRISFPNLKCLTVPNCTTPWVEFLLSRSPNIESLTLNFSMEIAYVGEVQIRRGFSMLSHLKSVDIKGFDANEDQVEFLRCLLERAIVLEKMNISTNGFWDDLVDTQLKEFEENLSTFKQVSPNVSIVFQKFVPCLHGKR